MRTLTVTLTVTLTPWMGSSLGAVKYQIHITEDAPHGHRTKSHWAIVLPCPQIAIGNWSSLSQSE